MKPLKAAVVVAFGAALAGVSNWVAGAAELPMPLPFGAEPIGMAVVGLVFLVFGVWRWRKITGT